METDAWKAQLKKERAEKDRFFAGHWQSPIPVEERAEFKGLGYYPPDRDHRFEVELHEHEDKERVRMAYTKGEEQEFVRWGEFRFRVGRDECVLQAYKGDPQEERLFIPFRDATSGRETYGAGRYLDLDAARNRTADGNGFLTSTGRTTRGACTARSTHVRSSLGRTGLPSPYAPARRTIP